MARTMPESNATGNSPPSRTSSRPRRRTDCMSLPFSSHPLYQLRRAIAICAILGAGLCILASSWSYYYHGELFHTAMFLGFSLFLCLLDLICWATKKKDNPDEEPDRPTGRWALMDLIMALLLQLGFWGFVAGSRYLYSYEAEFLLAAYGALAMLVCSILHFWCFWKQIMDQKKKAWLSTLQPRPCARCGYTEETNSSAASEQQSHEEQPNIFPYAGPSAEFEQANILTPESTGNQDSAMEEGLLIGSDFGSNYGSVDREEPVLEAPEGIVVGKGKKKVKSGGSQKGSTKGSPS